MAAAPASAFKLKSMTGFGEAAREVDGNAFHVELRSVNNRYLKTSLRLPEDYAFLEADLERLIREYVTRGSLYLRLYVRDLSPAAAHNLNSQALESYIRQLRAASADEAGLSIDLAQLALLPGVCQPREVTTAEREQRWEVVSELTRAALLRLVEMRTVEGTALAQDLAGHCELIRAALVVVRERVPEVTREYRDRLRDRVNQLLAEQNLQLAEESLAREVALYADRSDISEELTRLDGHLSQLLAVMHREEAAGRKLEFIAQELLREANTIGSKSGDATLAQQIIDIKSAIDRIKEQVLNVE